MNRSEHPSENASQPVKVARKRVERARHVVLIALTIALIAVCCLLALPFLPAITWGVALAIIAWPVHRWMSDQIANRGLAAGLSSAIVIIAILVPGLFVSYHLAREAAASTDRAHDSTSDGSFAKDSRAFRG